MSRLHGPYFLACTLLFACGGDSEPNTEVNTGFNGANTADAAAGGDGGATSGGQTAGTGNTGGTATGTGDTSGTTAGTGNTAGSDAGTTAGEDGGAEQDSGLGPSTGSQPCGLTSSEPGCNNRAVELCVCRGPDAAGGASECCTDEWDDLCVLFADDVLCKFPTTSCCESHATDGCDDPNDSSAGTVEECVCGMLRDMAEADGLADDEWHDCCNEGWNIACATAAEAFCGATCG